MTALGWLATLYSVWRPSAQHRSLCRFYRFTDPKMEAQYVQHSASMWRALLRIYCLVVFLFAIQEFFNYANTPESPPFWTLLSICAASLLVLFISCWRWALPYALLMLGVLITALSAVYMYHVRVTGAIYNANTMNYICSNGRRSVADPALYSRLEERVGQMVGQVILRDSLMYGCIHWICLSVAGLNGWTMLAYSAVCLSAIIGLCENPFINEKAVSAFLVVVCTLGFCLVSVVMERVRRSDFLAHTQLSRELHASQLADSVLNHMLKNVLADVAADIEVFLAGELGPEVLEGAVMCLRRGIRSCRERMVYLKMVAGEYVPVMNAINLKEFGQQLVEGRKITAHLMDGTVLMDGTLMQLILENALSNAVKHGHPEHPKVQFMIQQDACGAADRRQCFSFIVKNIAHPLRPHLTDKLVQTLLQGEAQVPSDAVLPTLSDGIGLLHCGLAARLGGIALSLRQDGDLVTFSASVAVDVPAVSVRPPREDTFHSIADQFPRGVRIFYLDDSASARRLMEFHLKQWCPAAEVQTYGASEDDVGVFVSRALQEADIVIMDQNLEYVQTYYGTDLCQQLVNEGFRGLICIRSSDDSQDDQAKYTESGAHCSFGKDLLGAQMVQQLKAAYVTSIGSHSISRSDEVYCASTESRFTPRHAAYTRMYSV